MRRVTSGVILILIFCPAISPACVNRFLTKRDGANLVVTVLTGSIAYEEAQSLRQDIIDGKAKPLQWLAADRKVVASQSGELKVIRPMPGGCEGRRSAVVFSVPFVVSTEPQETMLLKALEREILLARQK